MRKPSWITKSGPFVCSSLVNGYILVKPNATYTDEQMKEGQERIALHDKNMEKAEKAFKKQRREIPDA